MVDTGEEDFSIQFVAEPFAFEKDQEVLMYFNGKRELMQQIGRITDIVESESALTFLIAPVGDPISAESRENYRVSTIGATLDARVGEETHLKVQDLSATGFAVVASKDYQIGQTIEVEISNGTECCHGIASIQSIRDFGGGRIRYDMRAIDSDPHTSVFLETLQRISLAVQREQLQRA